LLPVAAQAGWDTRTPEKVFVYRGKPIDPRCVTLLDDWKRPAHVPLTSCTKPGTVARDGATFTVEEPDVRSISTPFDSYEVLARNGTQFVVSTLWSGGGSGRSSALIFLKMHDAMLSAEREMLSGGDRCNGGLFDSHVKNGVLYWSENITPLDMIAKGGVALTWNSNALEFGAQSCVGTLDWEYDLQTGNKRLVSETLTLGYFGGTREASTGLKEDQPRWTERYKAQHCFNIYYNGYVSRGKTVLSVSDMKAFAAGFAQKCLKNQ